ncbi:MAG: ABC transporter ATP-binding protein [Defluviitaleaceae bacterium]|nr:ABC transporter ATP-binding protein [Defluviitaleaceae bacterium]
MIVYENVTKKYGDVTIVDGLNLTIEDGEFVALIGPSGCGKTTTLKMLNRLIESNGGSICVNGKNINHMEASSLRREIGYVIQQIGLFPNMTVEENICVVPRLLKWDKERCRKRTQELLDMVGMPYDTNAKKYPNELSGGQQQRVGVLRALAAEPPIILMDEPFGALDPITRDILQDEVKALQKKLKKTIVFVTHDMDEAVKMADTIVFMSKGKILQKASPEEMLSNPADPIISNFMGKLAHVRNTGDLTCADVMKKSVFMVSENTPTRQCTELMKKREIDSAVIVDENNNFKGVVSVEYIRQHGKAHEPVSALANTDVLTEVVTTSARDAFDKLIEANRAYVIVLDEGGKVVGIITKTSMTKALASFVWGGSD